jgi:hypothetical protein
MILADPGCPVVFDTVLDHSLELQLCKFEELHRNGLTSARGHTVVACLSLERMTGSVAGMLMR